VYLDRVDEADVRLAQRHQKGGKQHEGKHTTALHGEVKRKKRGRNKMTLRANPSRRYERKGNF
jgi:hypothetical protein